MLNGMGEWEGRLLVVEVEIEIERFFVLKIEERMRNRDWGWIWGDNCPHMQYALTHFTSNLYLYYEYVECRITNYQLSIKTGFPIEMKR